MSALPIGYDRRFDPPEGDDTPRCQGCGAEIYPGDETKEVRIGSYIAAAGNRVVHTMLVGECCMDHSQVTAGVR
jgi:hypothetical protein